MNSNLLSFVLVFSTATLFAAKLDCRKLEKQLEKDTNAVSAFLAGGSTRFRTKSSELKSMVAEFVTDQYGDEFSVDQVLGFEDNVEADTDVGLVRSSRAVQEILNTASEWYESADRKKLDAAIKRLRKNRVIYALDTTSQGWGGSPASNVLLMLPHCKSMHVLFRGIVTD